MRINKLNAFWQFVILGVMTFAVVGFFLITLVGPTITDFVLEQQKLNAVVFANRLAAEFLSPEDFASPNASTSQDHFEQFVSNLQVSGLFRVKIWRPDGTIAYSDESKLIGKKFPLDESLQKAFNLETTVRLIKFDAQDPGAEYELRFGEGIESQAPITFGSSREVAGVLTTYARSGFLKQEISKLENAFVTRIVLSLALIFATLSLIVWRASRTVAIQQARLEEYASGLEKMVDQRTRELKESTEKQLRQAEELARVKDEFVALAAHQLRTPPSIINWYSEMLLSGEVGALSDKQKEYIEEIYHATQRMVNLINDFLNISRIESGSLAINPEPTNLSEVADSVTEELTPMINQRGTQIEKHYDKDVPIVNADRKFARIIFQNLISNAVKYTPHGGKVSIAIKKEEPNVLIEIGDNGYGIPLNQQEKVFTKLFRAENIRKKEAEGTGLGLYLVKSVVEQSGGTVRFESKENQGTTFYVTIPLSGMKKREGAVKLA